MALHTQAGRLHDKGRARTPHPAPGQGWQQVRPIQLRKRMRTLQPQARRSKANATTRASACLDLVADLLPALLLIALMVAGSGLFVVTFDYR